MGHIRSARWGHVTTSGLLVLGALVVSALIGEATLRLLGHRGEPQSAMTNLYFVDDPVLDWRYVPGSQVTIGNVVHAYNTSGFRDADHAVDKPSGVTRILVVGDSVTEGYGVEWRGVFSHVLQGRLGDGFEVINLAAGGLNTPQEVHLLEREGLRYKPDLVVLGFVLNDCDFYTSLAGARRFQARKDAEIGLLNIPINPRVKRLLKSSALVYFVKDRVGNLLGRLRGSDETDYFTRLWAQHDNRRKVTGGFDRLAVLQRQHGFGVLVVIWPLITDFEQYRFESVHQWVKEEAAKRSFSTLDLFPSLSQMPYRRLQIAAEDNVHPNAVGHGLAVDAFLQWYTHERPRTALLSAVRD